MIKHLSISPIHQAYIKHFIQHQKVMGYSALARTAGVVKELFYKIEEQGKTLDEITSQDIMNHYNYLQNRPNYLGQGGLSVHTINAYMYAIKLFFAYAEKIELIKINPMSTLRFRHQKESQREVLRKEEIKMLYDVCTLDQERAILGLFYGCGLRRTEAEKLNNRDVDFTKNYLYVRSGKGRKRRAVPIITSVVTDFKNYTYKEKPMQLSNQSKPNDKKAFMLNQSGTRMLGGRYWSYFKRILARSEINKKISLHHLRHSIATHLLAGGMSLEEVRDFLGHEYLESTQIYTRVHPNQLRL